MLTGFWQQNQDKCNFRARYVINQMISWIETPFLTVMKYYTEAIKNAI